MLFIKPHSQLFFSEESTFFSSLMTSSSISLIPFSSSSFRFWSTMVSADTTGASSSLKVNSKTLSFSVLMLCFIWLIVARSEFIFASSINEDNFFNPSSTISSFFLFLQFWLCERFDSVDVPLEESKEQFASSCWQTSLMRLTHHNVARNTKLKGCIHSRNFFIICIH